MFGKKFSHLAGCDVGIDTDGHNPSWHWGYQHWLFFLMGLSLMIVQIVDIINTINKKENA